MIKVFISVNEIQSSLGKLKIEFRNKEILQARASVAIILTIDEEDLSMCFIKRAVREGDPWSGQVAFPGGRASGSEDDATVAERETFEEIGMILSSDQRIGRLESVDVASNLDRQNLLLSPVVYFSGKDSKKVARAADPNEVDSVFWVSLTHLFDPRSGTTIRYPDENVGVPYPGISFERFVIWGLTLRVLRNFGEVIGRDLPH